MVRFNGDTERAKKPYEGLEPLVAADIADTIVYVASRCVPYATICSNAIDLLMSKLLIC
jgi:NADP-dependent 3-hydroxy acid dehydrogenase YdfG